MTGAFEMLQTALLFTAIACLLSFLFLHFVFYRRRAGTAAGIRALCSADLFRSIRSLSRNAGDDRPYRLAFSLEWACLLGALLSALAYGGVSVFLVAGGGGMVRESPDRNTRRVAVLRIYHPDRAVRAEDRITLQNIHRYLALSARESDVVDAVASSSGIDASRIEAVLRREVGRLQLTSIAELGPGHFALGMRRSESGDGLDVMRALAVEVARRTGVSEVHLNTGRPLDAMERVMIDVLDQNGRDTERRGDTALADPVPRME